MNLLEFENTQFSGLWNEETIKELEEYEPLKRREYTEKEMFPDVNRCDEGWENVPDEYYCWLGWRIPQWFK